MTISWQGYGTWRNYTPTRWVRETAEYHDFMVGVERGNLPLTLDHPAKEERWRRMVPYTYNCQELCTIFIRSASGRDTIRNSKCWMIAFMGSDGTEQEPALQRPDTHDPWLPTSLCAGRGVCDTTREYRIAINLQETIVQHYDYMCRAATES